MFDTNEPCGCEHFEHFGNWTDDGCDDSGPINGAHAYLAVEAGEREAKYIGKVCDECAHGHMANHLYND